MHRGNDVTAYGNKLRSIAAASLPAEIPHNARAVWFDADGTITVTDRDGGSAVTGFAVKADVELKFVPERIAAMSGATKLFYTIGT